MPSHSLTEEDSFSSDNSTSDHDDLTYPLSILLIGADSKTGTECIHHFARHPLQPQIHAFCEESSNLDPDASMLCASIIEGSARHAIDIDEALDDTNASWIVLCGPADKVASLYNRHNDRTIAAENTVRVLQRPRHRSVRVLAVSPLDNNSNEIQCNPHCHSHHSSRFGLLHKLHSSLNLRRRSTLHDCAGQDAALSQIVDRTTTVRTSLVSLLTPTTMVAEKDWKPDARRLAALVDRTLRPWTDRRDLAQCVVQQVLLQEGCGTCWDQQSPREYRSVMVTRKSSSSSSFLRE